MLSTIVRTTVGRRKLTRKNNRMRSSQSPGALLPAQAGSFDLSWYQMALTGVLGSGVSFAVNAVADRPEVMDATWWPVASTA